MLKETMRPGLSDYELYGEIKKVVYGTDASILLI